MPHYYPFHGNLRAAGRDAESDRFDFIFDASDVGPRRLDPRNDLDEWRVEKGTKDTGGSDNDGGLAGKKFLSLLPYSVAEDSDTFTYTVCDGNGGTDIC